MPICNFRALHLVHLYGCHENRLISTLGVYAVLLSTIEMPVDKFFEMYLSSFSSHVL